MIDAVLLRSCRDPVQTKSPLKLYRGRCERDVIEGVNASDGKGQSPSLLLHGAYAAVEAGATAAADEAGLAMLFTGMRHFRH